MIECHPIAPYTHGCYVTSMSKTCQLDIYQFHGVVIHCICSVIMSTCFYLDLGNEIFGKCSTS